jgi:uncharacterized membrane-anchored protein
MTKKQKLAIAAIIIAALLSGVTLMKGAARAGAEKVVCAPRRRWP